MGTVWGEKEKEREREIERERYVVLQRLFVFLQTSRGLLVPAFSAALTPRLMSSGIWRRPESERSAKPACCARLRACVPARACRGA